MRAMYGQPSDIRCDQRPPIDNPPVSGCPLRSTLAVPFGQPLLGRGPSPADLAQFLPDVWKAEGAVEHIPS